MPTYTHIDMPKENNHAYLKYLSTNVRRKGGEDFNSASWEILGSIDRGRLDLKSNKYQNFRLLTVTLQVGLLKQGYEGGGKRWNEIY